MIENPISSTSLYNQCSTLNYTQAAMMGLTGSSLPDSQQLGYSSHSNIPNIILTGTHSTSVSALCYTKASPGICQNDDAIQTTWSCAGMLHIMHLLYAYVLLQLRNQCIYSQSEDKYLSVIQPRCLWSDKASS